MVSWYQDGKVTLNGLHVSCTSSMWTKDPRTQFIIDFNGHSGDGQTSPSIDVIEESCWDLTQCDAHNCIFPNKGLVLVIIIHELVNAGCKGVKVVEHLGMAILC